MAKTTGLFMGLTVQDSGGVARDIANDVMTINVNSSRALIAVTGIDVDAMERLAALRDAEVSLTGVYNPAANKSHAVFKNLDNLRQFIITYTGATLTLTLAIESYVLARAADGGLTWTVTARSAGGTVSWT